MTKEHAEARTRTSRLIRARAEELYSAFLDPTVLIDWPPPGRCVTFRRAPPCAEGSAWGWIASTSANDGVCTSARDGAMARVELITGPERRRRWTDEQKQAVVAASLGVYGGMNENFVLVAGRSRWQADGV